MIKIEDNHVLVLVETAEKPEDIDRIRNQQKADAAREALLQKQSRREYLETQAQLARALTRLPRQKCFGFSCIPKYTQNTENLLTL